MLLENTNHELDHFLEALSLPHGSGENKFEPSVVVHYHITTKLEPEFAEHLLFHGRDCITDVGRSFCT